MLGRLQKSPRKDGLLSFLAQLSLSQMGAKEAQLCLGVSVGALSPQRLPVLSLRESWLS